YSFTNMIGNIIGGHWIDNFDRKKMLFTGMISVCVILFLYPLAQTGLQLFIARFFHGLAGGILIPAAFAYVGDQTSGKTRGKAMAFTGASIGIAAIVGPAVGGVLAAKASIETVFVSFAILFLISSLVIVFLIKESFHNSDRGRFNIEDFVPIIKHPVIILPSLASFSLMVSNGTLAFRSEEHTSELQSRFDLVCRLLLEKKNI